MAKQSNKQVKEETVKESKPLPKDFKITEKYIVKGRVSIEKIKEDYPDYDLSDLEKKFK